MAAPQREKVTFTAAERAQQVREVAEMISRGKPPYKIRAILCEKYGMTEATAQHRISAARAVLVDDHLKMPRSDKVSELTAVMAEVIEMSILNGRGNDAIGAARLIAELSRVNKD